MKMALLHPVLSPLGLLLLQIIAILVVARIFGALIARIGQPPVIGEMIAGIVLGPSLLGRLLPGLSGLLFPAGSLGNLQFLSEIGLILFMFITGMELDLGKLKDKARHAIVISYTSIIFPYLLGVGAAYFIYRGLAPAGVGFLAFALFMGIALSITAFPVLARILQARGLTKTSVGTLVLACAAFDDVTAWCILAVVVAVAKVTSATGVLVTLVLSASFVLVMFYVVGPGIRRFADKHATSSGILKQVVVMSAFFVLLVSAFATEAIGVHALFGAFLAGVIMPRKSGIREQLPGKIADVSQLLLLPLFFALTGLKTQIGLLNDASHWLICAALVLVAIIGKFGGSTLAAKLTGQSWHDSLTIGALMNTRGLMELIVLNIGYSMGILSPVLFAMLVLMALTTTFMTAPLLDLVAWSGRKPQLP
ncbi:cation:proton antiporter [Hufsiella ginkgonis]|uniref:Cation/H+ exchanger transmembrane domain-containing protein n=1 Tax=Hufsiella ginkgonis TaxID=2695274 RepID=A0A7K1Y239_9SPHI|nr:cation:proton antiporter [Hufsiella ginkgonis]MXV17252.1 hypothetical protein [Hufsiella ginkgonis]